MTKPKTPLALEAVRTTRCRKDRTFMLKDFEDNGWWEIIDDTMTVTRKTNESASFSSPLHSIPRLATKYDIFVALLPPAFVLNVLLERAHDRDGGLMLNLGNRTIYAKTL